MRVECTIKMIFQCQTLNILLVLYTCKGRYASSSSSGLLHSFKLKIMCRHIYLLVSKTVKLDNVLRCINLKEGKRKVLIGKKEGRVSDRVGNKG